MAIPTAADGACFKTLVCFANSRKQGGACVAGKELYKGKPGDWMRPVSFRETQALSPEERCCRDGKEPELLDIITVKCLRRKPARHQGENWLIDPGCRWEVKGRLAWRNPGRWLDSPGELWAVGGSSHHGKNNKLSAGDLTGSSLALIYVDKICLYVGHKAPERDDYSRVVRCGFIYNNIEYIFDVTDPFIEARAFYKEIGHYPINNCILCISISNCYMGYYYKLVSGILYEGRFL
jgi:hypothetical protein